MEAVRRNLLPNPRENANPLSILFFTWTFKLFKQGYKKIFELEDLVRPLKSDKSEYLGDILEKQWIRQTEISKNPSLIKALLHTFWKGYTYLGLVIAVNELVIKLSQPFILGRLLMYFRMDYDMSTEEALWYAGGIVLTNLLNGLLINQYYIEAMHYGMKIRVAVCSIIYRKALRLSQTALGETAFGKVVNLLSNDVSRFDLVTLLIHYMWVSPIMCIIITYFLWIEVQWAGIIGLSIIFIVCPLQSYTGKLSSRFRLQTALRTDERVRFMDEIISGIQVIKFYAWEFPFSKLVAIARKLELNIVQKNAYVRGLYMTFLLFTNRTGVFCTMLSIALLYGSDQITASKIFVISSFFTMVSQTMSQFFVRGVAEIAESLVALQRLRSFLMYEERQEYITDNDKNPDNNELIDNINENFNAELDFSKSAVSMKNVTARWIPLPKDVDLNTDIKHTTDEDDSSRDWKSPTLENINLELSKGLLIGVVGHVGSGKSSLLQALLRELPLESGSISLSGSVSYAGQVPWIFSGSIRQNILFGQEMDRKRFEDVVKVCDLIKDFEQFSNGEKTIIGERGASLSGGQKARINLARAVYRKADIYLLDDPLSAVDAHVGRHLFNQCIGPQGRLAHHGATRILVTHQVHFLKEADIIIALKDGKLEAVGSPTELTKSGVDIASLLESDLDDSDKPKKRISRTHSIASNDEEYEEEENKPTDNKSTEKLQTLEASSKGKVKGSVSLAYLKSAGNYCIMFILFCFFILSQVWASGADYWVSFWISQEEYRHYTEQKKINGDDNRPFNISVSNSLFSWVDDNGLLTTEFCIYIHGILIALLFIFGITRSMLFYTRCVRASQKLHNNMFKGIVSTTMRFYDTNPSGRILNRFSKDMGAVDELLPKAILDSSQVILNMTGSVILTAVVNPIFLAPILVLAVIFIFVRKIYLKTSKNIKRLEGISRSPVYTHIAASLNGLATIRAFKAQNALIEEFDNHQDLHSGCWYMFISTSSAFGLSLDIMCIVFICFITFFFVLGDNGVMGGNVGLAITQILSLTGMLQWGIRQSAEVANQMMSVERILEYRDLQSEPEPTQPLAISKSWPPNGKVEFREVYYKYYEEAEHVLKGLSFTVKPTEKIGIVGRTGAGKSSLIGALFRMAVIDGNVIIDGVDTSLLKLSDLRSNISIIPQDPVLFSGTLRRNLDPFEEYSDDAIWSALTDVDLKDVATSHLGLQSSVMAGGSNFSVGQRQLLCLARAILRNNRILVLDEATANVDPHTDTLIQQTIRQKFSDCTVLTVAHRLYTIMDSDAVLVMDAGKAVEYAAPYELLQIPNGIFREMVHTLGPLELERLTHIAEEKYRKNNLNK